MSTNVLALAPRRCVMLEGNPITQTRLEAAGCTVTTDRGQEVSLKAEGGATCFDQAGATRIATRSPAESVPSLSGVQGPKTKNVD